jgi:hypothetical protein
MLLRLLLLLLLPLAILQGEPWCNWLERIDRSQNIDIHLYRAGGKGATSAQQSAAREE